MFIKRDDFLHSLKEIFIDEIYYQHLGHQPYIIDCGANIGLSVIYLKELFPDARIIAFEPDEENFSLLEKNIASFGFSNVELRKEAIWIENANINFSAIGTLGSRIEKGANKNTSIVKAIRLKELLQKPVDFLKLDIEGAEYEVLKDVAEDISAAKNIFIEYHGNFEQNQQLTEIFELLVDNGFNFYIKEASPVYPTPFSRNKTSTFDLQINIFCFQMSNEQNFG